MSRRVGVIGGGHNGLVCATYLARRGLDVVVLERRPLLGGACTTESPWPGFRISRAAYVLGLFRPAIVQELALHKHGLRLLRRSPSSLTPLPDGRSLVLGASTSANADEIRRFSERDARAYPDYEALLERVASAVEPLLDAPPPELGWRGVRDIAPLWHSARAALRLGTDLPQAARVLLGSAHELLSEWFDSEPLRGTLATDALIGAWAAPSTPGTGYVLFHHVMGSVTGERGVWAYVEGGMGGLTEALAQAARASGVELRTEAPVSRVDTRGGRACGVVLADGEELPLDAVVSSADPHRTFLELLGAEHLPEAFARGIAALDFRSPVFKLNLALATLPRLRVSDRDPVPLTGTIHVGAQDLPSLEKAYQEACAGRVPERPLVELTLPSVLDPTLAPEGQHVASIFAQYGPAKASDDPAWPELREQMRSAALAAVEEVAPGFRDSILHCEVLASPDLESVFGLTGGNIFHGAMTPDRLHVLRPLPGWARYRTPVASLYLCGAGAHPGGGVMGACGRNAASIIARDLGSAR